MRTETWHIFEVKVRSLSDAQFMVAALEGAAREWATCSNEGEPLLALRDQIREQIEGR